MLRSSLPVAAAFLVPLARAASSCLSVDANFNLLAFNLNGKDYNAGGIDQWASGIVNTYVSYFPPSSFFVLTHRIQTDMHIYSAEGNSWSTQKINIPDGFDSSSLTAVLDHDTNVFYGLSKGGLYSLTLGDTLTTATSDAKGWEKSSDPPFDASNYKPVMGLAQNHIHLLNVPNVEAGSAQIFVVHFAFWQPEIQSFGKFPSEHGQAPSIFLTKGFAWCSPSFHKAQQEFAFIPDSGENTYVINVMSNTTKTLPGPTTKDALATYFGAPNSIIQLTSSGAMHSASGGSWSSVQALAKVAPPVASSSSSASGSQATGSKSSGSKTSGSGASSASSTGTPNAAFEATHFSNVLALVMTTVLIVGGLAF
ncbi:hypothetical protein DL96DRAFT_1598908 [Flagelloscypha sp. PMI_526]|nr:hypothetical protein DL96DRAFT_1598908 [Flagelloscypha sp. PMI_526]